MILTNLSKIWLGDQFPTQNSCVIKQGDYLSCLFGENSCRREKMDVLGSFQLAFNVNFIQKHDVI